jgi:hypothetical protein
MIAAILPAVLAIIEKVIPDPKAAADAKLRALELAQRGDLAALDAESRIATAQAATNTAEAQAGAYRGGWRPAVGWTCAAALAYQYLGRPLLPWIAQLFGSNVPPLPPLDIAELYALLFGMLGLGSLRTVERLKGKA